MMRALLLAGATALTLAGCLTVDQTDQAIRQHLEKTCLAINTTHGAFLAVNAVHPLKRDVVAAELAAFTEAENYCAHPETASTVTAVTTVVRLSLAILAALREAEKVEGV